MACQKRTTAVHSSGLAKRCAILYGPLVVKREMALASGGTTTGAFQNPLAMFQYHCKHSAHYSNVVKDASAKYPCTPASPWRIILYQDGVDPSDGLAKNHSQKKCSILLGLRRVRSCCPQPRGTLGDHLRLQEYLAPQTGGNGQLPVRARAVTVFWGDP